MATAVFKLDDIEKIRGKLGCVTIEGDRVTSFVEKPANPTSSFTSIPYYVFSKDTLPLIREYAANKNNVLDTPGSLISYLVGKTTVFAYTIAEGYYFDVGTVETYEMLKKELPKKLL